MYGIHLHIVDLWGKDTIHGSYGKCIDERHQHAGHADKLNHDEDRPIL